MIIRNFTELISFCFFLDYELRLHLTYKRGAHSLRFSYDILCFTVDLAFELSLAELNDLIEDTNWDLEVIR